MVTLDPTASRGYGGADQSIDEPAWATISPYLGSAFPEVVGRDDLKVTAAAGDRTVRVAAGVTIGFGVQVTVLAPVTLQLAAPPTNSNRWDAVVLRRDWTATPGGTSSVIVVQNNLNNSKTLPAGLEVTPGSKHDQLLALVQVSSNSTLPSAFQDLRATATKIYSAASTLALPNARQGAEAFINGVRYRRDLDTANNLAWLTADGYQVSTDAAVLAAADGFNASIQTIRGMHNPSTGDVQLDISLRHNGPDIIADDINGNFADILMATIQPPFRPDISLPSVGGRYQGRTSTGAVFDFPFGGFLGSDGRLIIQSGVAGIDLPYQAPNANGTPVHSIRAHVRFTKEV